MRQTVFVRFPTGWLMVKALRSAIAAPPRIILTTSGWRFELFRLEHCHTGSMLRDFTTFQ